MAPPSAGKQPQQTHSHQGHHQPRGGQQPVSRDLGRIIRESSKLQAPRGEGDDEGVRAAATGRAGLDGHLQAIEARQRKALEFYLRACALRLSQGQ